MGLLRQRCNHIYSGFSPQKVKVQQKESIDDRIRQLEQQVNQLDGKVFEATSTTYGKGENVELFKDKKYNISENKDLRALERRLPKGWKKPKWTPRTYSVMKLWIHSILSPSQIRRNESDKYPLADINIFQLIDDMEQQYCIKMLVIKDDLIVFWQSFC